MAAAAKKAAEVLKEIYTNAASPGGFAGVQALYRDAMGRDKSITLQHVKHFLEGQRTYGLFKPRRLRYPRSRTFAAGYFSDAQADLAGIFFGGREYYTIMVAFRFSKLSAKKPGV